MSDRRALKRLHELLTGLFAIESLREFLLYGPAGDRLAPRLPGGKASLAEVADAALQALSEEGLLDRAFFQELIDQRRDRAAEIREVASAFLPDAATLVPGTARAERPAPPTKRPWIALAIGLALLLGAAATTLHLVDRPSSGTSSSSPDRPIEARPDPSTPSGSPGNDRPVTPPACLVCITGNAAPFRDLVFPAGIERGNPATAAGCLPLSASIVRTDRGSGQTALCTSARVGSGGDAATTQPACTTRSFVEYGLEARARADAWAREAENAPLPEAVVSELVGIVAAACAARPVGGHP